MKKLIATTMAILCMSGCGAAVSEPEPEHTRYALQGRYYADGICEDINGNLWGYTADMVSK